MALRNKSKKGLFMTILTLVMFMLMLAELLSFVVLNTTYNSLSQLLVSSSSSINYGRLLQSGASTFAKASLAQALATLTNYEYNASLRQGNFIANFSEYMSYLIENGTLPYVSNSNVANVLLASMGNFTLSKYNQEAKNLIPTLPSEIHISETTPDVYQANPYSVSLSYIENVQINSTSGIYNYSIPINVNVTLNGTPDLFYAQQGIIRDIKFGNMSNMTNVIGNSYAKLGNPSSFVYGIVYDLPAGTTCGNIASEIPTQINTAPFNSLLILVTANAIAITNGTCKAANNYGGLITYQINNTAAPPTVPYLVYPSGSGVINYLKSYEKVLLYGPAYATINIEDLRNVIANGYYFASPFAPSYFSRSESIFTSSSPDGIFTFSNYNRKALNISGTGSNVTISHNYPAPSALTISVWFYPTKFDNNYQFPIDSSPEATWRIGFNSANDIFVDAGSHNDVSVPVAISFDKWSNIVVTAYNSNTATNYTIYYNGTKISSGSVSSVIQPVSSIILGSDGYTYYGSIANVQIYNESLLPQQVQQLYQSGIAALPIPNAGLIGWWPLDGNANDYSGAGNSGTMHKAAYIPLDNYTRDSIFIAKTPNVLPIPGIMSCDNLAQCTNSSLPHLYLSNMPLEFNQGRFQTANFSLDVSSWIYSHAVIVPNGANTVTITAWIKPRTIQGDGTYAGIVRIDGNAGTGTGLLLSLQGSSGYPSMATWSNDFVPTSGPKVNYNQWNFLAVRINGTDQALLYVNGQAESGTLSDSLVPSLKYGGYSTNFSIGSTDSPGRLFNGSIANVQVYLSPLSVKNLSGLYARGIEGVPLSNQNLVGWWPLDGNANDYSGSAHNGTAVNVNYPFFSGQYNLSGLSTVSSVANEWQAIGIPS